MKNCKDHSGVCVKMDSIHEIAVETRGWVIKLFAGIIVIGVLNIFAILAVTMVSKAVASGQ